MVRFIIVIVLFASVISNVCLTPVGEGTKNDEEAYYGRELVEGTITILNHPTLGRTPDVGDLVVFQRMDCRQCVVGVETDSKGRYRVFLGAGRYKLIMRKGTRDTQDVLAPGQPRYLNVNRSAGAIQTFDISTVLPQN